MSDPEKHPSNLDAFHQDLVPGDYVAYIRPRERYLEQGQIEKITKEKIVVRGHYLDPAVVVRLPAAIQITPR